MPDFATLKPVSNSVGSIMPDFATLKPVANATSPERVKPAVGLPPDFKTALDYSKESLANRKNNIQETTKAYTEGKIGLPQAFVNNIGQVIGGAFDIAVSPVQSIFGSIKPAETHHAESVVIPKVTDWLSKKLADPLVSTYQNAGEMSQHAGDLYQQAHLETDPVKQQKLLELAKGTSAVANLMIKKADEINTSYQENAKTGEAGVNIGSLGLGADAKPAFNEISDLSSKLVTGFKDTTQNLVQTAKNTVTETTAKAKNYVSSKLTQKTAEEVLATPETGVPKLSADEQKLWYKNKAQQLSQDAIKATDAANTASEQSLTNAKNKITDFQQNLGKVTRETAVSLKKPAQQLIKDSSSKYVELSGEAADGSPALKKSIPSNNLVDAINSKFEYSPDVGTSLKNELGLNETPSKVQIDPKTKLPIIQGEAPAVKNLTNQELLNKAREIMQSVSKTAKAGSKVYSFEEYQAMQKYRFLMEQLSQNGVDMTKANQFWREWAPVRDRIVREIKPFDESNVGKLPFTSTLQNSEAVANTAKQAASKLDAQNFINEIETRLKLPKGSIGKDTGSVVQQLEKAKLDKVNMEKLSSDILDKIKADKAKALQEMSLEKYNTLEKARVRKIIQDSIIKAVKYTAGAVGFREIAKHLPI